MEKPPLLYWLTAFSFALFGEAEWVVRLVPALACLACVGWILWFSKKMNRESGGRFAAVVFVSGLGVTAMARTLMFDMLLTCFLTGAVMHAYLYLNSRKQALLYRTMALLALALLAKGFVSLILFTAIVGAYTLVSATSVSDFFKRIAVWFNWRGIAVFVAISAPWHIAAMLTEPIFAWFYFINEHILRFLGKREPHDYYAGAWWYYLPRALLFLFPWSLLLPSMLFSRANKVKDGGLHLFLLMSWLMPLLFFSVSSAKANYYLVIIMPLAAMQLALLVEDKLTVQSLRLVIPGLILVVFFCAGVYWFIAVKHERMDGIVVAGMPAAQFSLYCLFALLLTSTVSAVIAYRLKSIGVLAYLLLPIMSLPMLLQTLTALDDFDSTKTTVNLIQHTYPAGEILLFHVFEQQSSLPFYLKKPVRIVESHSSDLFWGNKLHKNNIVMDDAAFDKITETQKVSLLVVKQDLSEFKQKSYADKFKLVAQRGNTSVFSN